MENQINKEDSKFCDCETEFRTIVLVQSPDGGKMTLDGKPYIESSREDALEPCATCGKTNKESLCITFNINPSVELTGE